MLVGAFNQEKALVGAFSVIVQLVVEPMDRFTALMKENTLVDRMVLLDCLANISIIGVMFLAFPTRVWGSSLLCLPITFFRSFVLVLNR